MSRRLLISFIACISGVCWAQAGIHVSTSIIAGTDTVISTTGSGKATFYLVGPGVSQKRNITLGGEIRLSGRDVQNAGEFSAILCTDTCRSASFYVSAAEPVSLTFLVHPSRVPVAQGDAVSGVAFPFDQFHNLVLAPLSVNFRLMAGKAALESRDVNTRDGVAWFRASSGKSAGALQVIASIGDLSTRRVVQQVASDPCNLRIIGQRTATGIQVQTEPVHDCSGNPVPDGTIVSFTATDTKGKCTVDAPIKQGVAQAQIEATGDVLISVASGVVMGNELRVGARP